MISYTITALDEYESLSKLISIIETHMLGDDEIVIQLDSNATNEVKELAQQKAEINNNIKIITYSLDGDFSRFKNNILNYCNQPWIFNIDADELPSENLLANIHSILEANDEVEVFILPRWNTVNGITEQHIANWRWKLDEFGRINWPDWQMRIWKNIPSIHWVNKVHEVLTGFTKYTFMPDSADFCLYHPKNIDRQERQNELYSKLG